MTKQETLEKFHNGDINSFNVAKEFGKEDSDKLDTILDKFDEAMDAENADQGKVIEEYIGKIDALANTNADETKADKPAQPTIATIESNENKQGYFKGIFFLPTNVQDAIRTELQARAEKDEHIATIIKKENKSFGECYKFIADTLLELVSKKVNKQKVEGLNFSDADTFNLAIYYFENDNVPYKMPKKASVPTSTTTTSTKAKGKSKQTTKSTAKTEDKIVPMIPKADTQKPKQTKKEQSKAQTIDMFADFFK